MFTNDERAEIRMLLYAELIKVHEMMLRAGSYEYLCLVGGHPVYAHQPVGQVLWKTPW